jgi:hypothetical protein
MTYADFSAPLGDRMSQLRIQNARAVAYRALCLGALLKRGEFELELQNLDEWSVFDSVRQNILQQHQSLNEQLMQWLDEEGIHRHLSESEQFLLNKTLGTWTERTLITVGWRIEALGTMLWALQRLDSLPSYDNQFEPAEILEPLDLLNPTIDFIWMASLRDDESLSAGRDQAELWNWRSRARELERMGVRPPEGFSFRQIIHQTSERACRDGHISHMIDGDFPAFGKAYADLTPDEYALMSAIAYERYSALNWVCEVTNEWESIRIDRK